MEAIEKQRKVLSKQPGFLNNINIHTNYLTEILVENLENGPEIESYQTAELNQIIEETVEKHNYIQWLDRSDTLLVDESEVVSQFNDKMTTIVQIIEILGANGEDEIQLTRSKERVRSILDQKENLTHIFNEKTGDIEWY